MPGMLTMIRRADRLLNPVTALAACGRMHAAPVEPRSDRSEIRSAGCVRAYRSAGSEPRASEMPCHIDHEADADPDDHAGKAITAAGKNGTDLV